MPTPESLDTYPLRTVSRLTGLSPDIIRAWEKRYAVVAPARGPRGARLYTRDDIDHLRSLARAVRTGRAIGDVARLDREYVKRLADEAVAESHEPSPTSRAAGESIVERALAAVKIFDDAALRSELGDGLAALGPLRFVREIAAPLLTAVGEGWHRGEFSVAQEHIATAALRNFLHTAIASRRSRSKRPCVLLATTSGEQHEGGLLMVALLLLEERIEIAYLGPEVPADDIVATAKALEVGVVALSFTAGEDFDSIRREIRRIDRGLPPGVEIWLGGVGVNADAERLKSTRTVVFKDLDALHERVAQLRDIQTSGS